MVCGGGGDHRKEEVHLWAVFILTVAIRPIRASVSLFQHIDNKI